jgi:hemolysin activation/secretion protein
LSRNWEVGGYALFSRTKLGEEFAGLDSKGKAEIYGGYSSYNWIERDNLAVGLNLGFDSKYIYNELLGAQLSRDVLSIAKGGFDVDYIDYWGRTILTAQLDQGIPEFLGALDRKDADASRAGAGGKFTKWGFNLFRLQPAFWETSVLLKNSFQLSNNTLSASEQFQVGGATSVRGYPSGEYSGDSGFYSAFEWSIPPYGLSKDLNVPFYNGNVRLYDAFRWVLFWDIGYVHNNTPGSGEKENQTLRAAGFGARLTMAEDCEVRVETGYPLGGPAPSDDDTAHTWVEVHLKF